MKMTVTVDEVKPGRRLSKTRKKRVEGWLKHHSKASHNKYLVLEGKMHGSVCYLGGEVQLTSDCGDYIVSVCGYDVETTEHRNFVEYSFVFDGVRFFWTIDR